MRERLTTFSVIAMAFLIYPLSLSSQNSFSMSLDANGVAGDQAVTSLDRSPDQIVSIQVFGTNIQNARSISARFEYDASQVVYEGFDAGSVFPGAHVLPEQGTGFVEIGMGAFGGQATVNSGLVGTIRFRTTATFRGTTIRLVRGVIGRDGRLETVTLTARVELQISSVATAPSPDFNGDGIVNAADFSAFANFYGTQRGDGTYQAKYDLDSNDIIGVSDLLIFMENYGKQMPAAGSGGGGSGGSSIPDLIVESLSVSNSSPNAGQSFTLRATVRNQGTDRSAATTLRYYRSSNATISRSDTEVGTDSVSGLSASGTRAESISMNAPPSAGTYYYGACVDPVSGESDTDNNCSTGVRVTVAAGDDHSNNRSGATSLSLGGSRSGRIETGSDVDYFRVQISESGALAVYTTGNVDTYGTLQNSSGSTLASDDDSGDGYNFRIEQFVSSGTYYIRVEGYRSSDTGDYTIHAQFVSGGSNQEVYSLDSRSISVAFSPDGRYIATGDDEGDVDLWEVSSGTHLWFKSLGGEVASVAFSLDGNYVAADGSDSNGRYVALLGVSSGTEIQRTGVDASSSDADRVNSVTFSPDGNYVAIGVDLRWAWLWDLSGDRQRRGWGNTDASEVYAVAFSPDGRYLATGDDDGYATLWEVSTWWTDDVNTRYMAPGGNVRAVAFSPDGQYLATDGYDGNNTDITLWEVSSGTRVRQLNAGNVFAIAFRPDGRYLAAGDDDGIITFWRTDGWVQEKQIQTGSDTVTDLAWSPGGNLISDGKKVYQPLLSR